MKNLQAFIIGLMTILIVGAGAANAATWTVTKSANSNDGVCDADCSLREAVAAADSGDTVVFNANLVGQIIRLGGSEIVVTKRITIDGFLNDPNVAFISGSETSRIFLIETGGSLELKNMLLVQGNGVSSQNSNTGNGGAIFAKDNSTLTLDRVAVRGNQAHFVGAISLNLGTHRFVNSSITSNTAKNGTAISVDGSNLFMANVTVSGNYDDDTDGVYGLGAIYNDAGNITIRNSTIVNNFAGQAGGGIYNNDGNINLGNTIVAQNQAPTGADIRNAGGTITSVGGNLIGDLDTVPANTFNKPKDVSGINPLLAPTNAGGDSEGFPVAYHRLQAGSPARNGGVNANAVEPLANSTLTTDARGAGFGRIKGASVDSGAFEDDSGNTSLIVTKKINSNDLVCDLDCSLHEAVHQASLNFGTETITFAPNVFGTMTLGGSEILIKNQNVNIVGYPKASTLTISGGDATRIFKLENAIVGISGLTLADGDSGANGLSGAIYGDESNLTLDRVMITRNKAAAFPALYLSGGSTQRITNSTISGNAGKLGVGVGIKDTALFMANTTVSGNFDSDGGFGNGSFACEDSQLTVRNSTVAFNSVPSGGSAGFQLIGCAFNIGNSIVANNQAGANDDIQLTSGSIVSVGGNLIGDTNGFPVGTFSQTNDQTGVNPLLTALADNGGSVRTLALAPNSPAINTGVNANAVNPFDNLMLSSDARGNVSRILNNIVDKGAFESFAPTAATVSVSGKVTDGKRGTGRARVEMVDRYGVTRTALTNQFGYFRFEEVESGATYIFSVNAKNLQFQPRVVSVFEQIDDLIFAAESGL